MQVYAIRQEDHVTDGYNLADWQRSVLLPLHVVSFLNLF